MMKKLLSMLLALMLLCGCAAFAEAVDYVGLWNLTGAEMGGAPIDLSIIGLTMSMDLREDGTCTLTTMGMPEEGVWAVADGTVAVTDSYGDVQEFVMADGKLEASQDNMKIIFVRAGDAASFVGVWELTGVVAEGMTMGPETMAMFGLTMTLTLNEDGTCAMDTAGEVDNGVWKTTEAGVSIDDGIEVVELVYADEMLVIEEDGGKMMLTRQGAAPAVADAAAQILAGVPAEAFEGKWELATANVFGMELSAEDVGIFMSFELAEGKGVYTESDAEGESLQLDITYTVTETEGEGTLLTLLYQDATMEEPVELLAMNMLDDGCLSCTMDVEGMEIGYCFAPVVEEIPAE